jgi:P pilus assembly chaperone PapD
MVRTHVSRRMTTVISAVRWDWRQIVIAALVILVGFSASAGVSIYPTEVFISAPNHSATLTVTNPSDSVQEVWVGFSYNYPVAFDSGKVVMSDEDVVPVGDLSATSWLRAFPQRFTLRANESQVIRVLASPPGGLVSGEYWARVVVSSKPKNPRVIQRKSAQTPVGKMNIELVSRTSVPFHFRNGVVNSSIVVKQARAYIDDGALKLRLDLRRMGNASFWGRFTMKLLNAVGKTVRTRDFRIVVYKDMMYAAQDVLPDQYSGPYTVELSFDNAHPSVSPDARIKSEPFLQRIPVTVY